jgi:hypothetical protein
MRDPFDGYELEASDADACGHRRCHRCGCCPACEGCYCDDVD